MLQLSRAPSLNVCALVLLALVYIPLQTTSLGPLSPRWHLQRIAQRQGLKSAQLEVNLGRSPLPRTPSDTPVNIYVVDSGVRISHEEFNGRASYGPDFVSRGATSDDCQGHGTNVAALAAGRFSGVARSARIISVRILDCTGHGFCTDVVRALQWVHDDVVARLGMRAVVVLSLGSRDARCGPTVARTEALEELGVVVVAAVGNSRKDSCAVYPARNAATIAVGATDRRDRVYRNNNLGACIDLFAPGVAVVAAWGARRDDEYRVVTGTSMATPLVAGTAALIMAADSRLSGTQVREVVMRSATVGKVRDADGKQLLSTHANRLLYAPWAQLFDEVPREVSLQEDVETTGQHGGAWAALTVDFVPRVKPAMLYSTDGIREALAKSCGMSANEFMVRRVKGVRRFRNGSEPDVIKLRVYVKAPQNETVVFRHLNRAVGSGLVANSCMENIRFYSRGRGQYVELGVEMPKAIYDHDQTVFVLDLDATSIITIAVSLWITMVASVALGIVCWKGKWKSQEPDERGSEKAECSENPSKLVDCPLTPEIQLEVDETTGEVSVLSRENCNG